MSTSVDLEHSAVEDLVQGFLDRHDVMTVAVADPQGVPWAAPVFYVNDGFRIYWLANPNNRLGAYLRLNPRAVVTIVGRDHEWRRARGLQIEGRARMVDSWREYLARTRLFLRKFSGFGREFFHSKGGRRLLQNAPMLRLYELDGDRCWFTDHSRGLGNRLELDLRRAVTPDARTAGR